MQFRTVSIILQFRYIFLCDDWLSCNHGNGSTSSVLTEVTYDPKIAKYVSDQQQKIFYRHLVLSLFRRNSTSRYTRLQRVAVLSTMFFLMMVSSAMWHGTDEKSEVSFKFKMGPFSMGWNEFYVGCMTVLTVYPVILVISELFRRTKIKKLCEDNPEEKFKLLDEGIEREFPRWVLVVAWILVFVAIVTASFFTFLYSLEWGGDKSNEWLGAFFLSSFQALLFLDPMIVSLTFHAIFIILQIGSIYIP